MTSAATLPERTWVDGQEGATVALLDRGLQYGDGLFETMAGVGGGVRFLSLHLKRLESGCERLGIQTPHVELLRREIGGAAAGVAPVTVKLILTRGRALARGYAVSGHEHSTRILLRYARAPAELQPGQGGVRVRVAHLRLAENPALAGMKHLNRLEQVLARLEWDDPDIAEALMLSASGELICGTASNVFVVRAGRLLTPRLDRCGVAGVMREVVGGLAAQAGIDFEKRPLDLEDVKKAEELFLTNALTGIRPITEAAGRALAIGPLTRRLQSALAPLLQRPEGVPP